MPNSAPSLKLPTMLLPAASPVVTGYFLAFRFFLTAFFG